jgi:hypothetical protein
MRIFCGDDRTHPDYVAGPEIVQHFAGGLPRVLPSTEDLQLYLHLVAQIDGVSLLHRKRVMRG